MHKIKIDNIILYKKINWYHLLPLFHNIINDRLKYLKNSNEVILEHNYRYNKRIDKKYYYPAYFIIREILQLSIKNNCNLELSISFNNNYILTLLVKKKNKNKYQNVFFVILFIYLAWCVSKIPFIYN